MGANYYLRRKEPELYTRQLQDIVDWQYWQCIAHPEQEIEMQDHMAVHIAKTSWGWVPSFQRVPANMPFDETERNGDRYSIMSVADIKRYWDTGDYEIMDEDGDVVDWEWFDHHVLHWVDRMREHGFKGEPRSHAGAHDALDAYRDAEGYQFCRVCFC